MPAAWAAAAAPSAFDTLWRPASGSRTRAFSAPMTSVNAVMNAPDSMRPAMPSARTSAGASTPKRRMRAPRGAIACHCAANGSSALMTAVPLAVESGEQLALGARDAGEVAEALEVFVAGIRDQRDRRLRECGERGDLARVIRAHLDHGMPVRGLEPQQRQRHADVVVEVAAGRERRARAGEDRRQQFLGGRLAVAAADAEHEGAAACAPGGGKRSRAPPACRRRPPAAGSRRRRFETTAPAAPRAAAAATNALPSKRSPRERHEQHARLDRARVGGHAGECRIGARQAPADDRRDVREPALHAAPPARSRRRSRSLKARRSRPTIW